MIRKQNIFIYGRVLNSKYMYSIINFKKFNRAYSFFFNYMNP
jgi:hypothetical protein